MITEQELLNRAARLARKQGRTFFLQYSPGWPGWMTAIGVSKNGEVEWHDLDGDHSRKRALAALVRTLEAK